MPLITELASTISWFCCGMQLVFIYIWSLQEEERHRNSVMCDLLYVHPLHPLGPHVLSYYHLSGLVPLKERHPCAIDTNARLASQQCC